MNPLFLLPGQRHFWAQLLVLCTLLMAVATARAQAFSGAAQMATVRTAATATLLPNGKVLVAGGRRIVVVGSTTSLSSLSSAELYDPATNSWSPAGSLSATRYFATATLLPNGRVLVAGGLALTRGTPSCKTLRPTRGPRQAT